jgi:hypothetical protein
MGYLGTLSFAQVPINECFCSIAGGRRLRALPLE